MAETFVSKDDLQYFNSTVNDRIKNRLKYKGDFTLTETQTNWNTLAPTEIGHIYQLVGDISITIGDTVYDVGDWIIAMNRTFLSADGVVDEHGDPTNVIVKRFSVSIDDLRADIANIKEDKLDKEPGGLNTVATEVVNAINEVNDKTGMKQLTISGSSGTFSVEDYSKLSAHPENYVIKRGGEIYQYTFNDGSTFYYYTNRPGTTNIIEAWIKVDSTRDWSLKLVWDDNSVFTRTDTKYMNINTETDLNNYIAAMPNNSIKDAYSTPWGMTEPGWTTIHKYNNNFVKIIHWTRREHLAYVRSRDNSTTWSDWYQLGLAKTTDQKQGMMGNFLEIKNGSYEFNTFGGMVQLNHQRNNMGFMAGNNVEPSVINNPDGLSFSRPAAPDGWTHCIQFTSANGTCKFLWDNNGKRMGYTESGCSYFGRHCVICAAKT